LPTRPCRVPIEDPSGNILHLIEVQIREVPFFTGLRVYNSGMVINEMTKALDYYENILGFEEWSRNYLPDAMPLKHKDGSFAFMVHQKKELDENSAIYGEHPQIVLILEVADILTYKSYLTGKNIKVAKKNDKLIIRDPEGNFIEVIEVIKN